MSWTYIIQNLSSGRRYVGSTDDIERRLEEHNRGQTRSTRYGKGTWEVIYSEKFVTLKEARTRERVIKSYKGGNALKQLLAKRE